MGGGGFGSGMGGGGSGSIVGGGGFGCIGGSLSMNPTMLEQAQQMMGGGFGGMGGGFGPGGGFGGGAAWAAAALATKRLLPLPGVPQCAYRDSSVPPRLRIRNGAAWHMRRAEPHSGRDTKGPSLAHPPAAKEPDLRWIDGP